jgi:hypothetical protein
MNFDMNRTGMTDPVREWAVLPEEMPLRRVFVYAPYGLYGGSAAWIVAIAVVVTVGAALVGSALALTMVVALVGGPISIVASWLLVRHDSLPKWLDQLYLTDRLDLRELAASITVGAAFIGAVGFLWPQGVVLLAFVGTFVLAMVSSAAETTVEFDSTRGRVVVQNDRRWGGDGTKLIDLANVAATYRAPLSALTLYGCRRGGGKPVFVTVPERHRPAFERALEDGRRAESVTTLKTPSTTRPMRIMLAVVSLKFFAIAAAGAHLIADSAETGTGRALAGLSTLLFFGAIALWYACHESLLARRERARSEG